MDAQSNDTAISRIAGAIAEPARTKMLCSLMDGHARTSTEMAVVADVSASTASAHLARLRQDGLVRLHTQGRHRYYSLADAQVAQAIEALMVIGQNAVTRYVPTTPTRLQFARTCYDHMAGTLAVRLHDHFMGAGWLTVPFAGEGMYQLTMIGEKSHDCSGYRDRSGKGTTTSFRMLMPGLEHAAPSSCRSPRSRFSANGHKAQMGYPGP